MRISKAIDTATQQKWPHRWGVCIAIAALATFAAIGRAQSIPATQGETLSGQKIQLADAVRNHRVVLIGGFSHEAGNGCGPWFHQLRADPALKGVDVYQIAMLEKAPSFIRGTIKSGMRKGLSPAEQDNFVVFTQDDAGWRGYFQVQNDKEPYVVLLDASGQVRWRGHGAAKDLEAHLRSALP